MSPAQGHAIRKVTMNHLEPGRPGSAFYLINTALPEVGRFSMY